MTRKHKITITNSREVRPTEAIFKQILRSQFDIHIFTKYLHRPFIAVVEADEQLDIYTAVAIMRQRGSTLQVLIFGTSGFQSPLDRAKSLIRLLKIFKNIISDEFSGMNKVRIAVRRGQSDMELVIRLLKKHNYVIDKSDKEKIIYRYERPV